MTTILLHPTAANATPPGEDDRLVRAVRAGDDRAFVAIVTTYEAPLLAYARQLLGGAHHDAEECVQDTFVRSLKALRGSDRPMALKPWLYAILRNRCLDQLRKPNRTTDLALLEPVLHDVSADPHDAAIRRDDLRGLVGDLNRLPARQRTALVMHELEGASHADIAERLHVSVGATKALVHRARGALSEARATGAAA
jgi:RNA polymerase sigma-70 factor (ECF subfamily)